MKNINFKISNTLNFNFIDNASNISSHVQSHDSASNESIRITTLWCKRLEVYETARKKPLFNN